MSHSHEDHIHEQVKEMAIAKLHSTLKELATVEVGDLIPILCEDVKERAGTMANGFRTIAPYGEWSSIIEGEDKIKNFILSECSKSENWEISGVVPHKTNKSIVKVYFANKAVDDGDKVEGVVFITTSGKIKHAFVQGED